LDQITFVDNSIFKIFGRGKKKYRPHVNNNREKMMRKKKQACNSVDPPSIDPSSNAENSSNPISNLATSSDPIFTPDISFFNTNYKDLNDKYFYHRPLLLEKGALLDQLKDMGCDVIFALHQWNFIVDIKKTDKAYDTLVKIFYANMHDIKKDDDKFKSLVRN
ncbi:unnamed protein product, partial [Ilex paraguariensis]